MYIFIYFQRIARAEGVEAALQLAQQRKLAQKREQQNARRNRCIWCRGYVKHYSQNCTATSLTVYERRRFERPLWPLLEPGNSLKID